MNVLSLKIFTIMFIFAITFYILTFDVRQPEVMSMDQVMTRTPHVHVYFVDCSRLSEYPDVLITEKIKDDPNRVEGVFLCYERERHQKTCSSVTIVGSEIDPILHWVVNLDDLMSVGTQLSKNIVDTDKVQVPAIDSFFVAKSMPENAKFELREVLFYHCDYLIDIDDTPIGRMIQKGETITEITLINDR